LCRWTPPCTYYKHAPTIGGHWNVSCRHALLYLLEILRSPNIGGHWNWMCRIALPLRRITEVVPNRLPQGACFYI